MLTLVADTALGQGGCEAVQRTNDENLFAPDPETCQGLCDTRFVQYWKFEEPTVKKGFCACYQECSFNRPAKTYTNPAQVYELIGKMFCRLHFI